MTGLDRPGAVRPGEELDAGSLASFLRARLPGAAGGVALCGLAARAKSKAMNAPSAGTDNHRNAGPK